MWKMGVEADCKKVVVPIVTPVIIIIIIMERRKVGEMGMEKFGESGLRRGENKAEQTWS
jgi:hypothetical protein